VNAHFIGQDGVETGFDGTWMSALGIKWNEGFNTRHLTVTVKQVIPTLFEGTLKTSFPLVSWYPRMITSSRFQNNGTRASKPVSRGLPNGALTAPCLRYYP
jgi:hypothetical protein